MSDIGATEFGRWQLWQLRCRIGAMSLLKVTSPADCSAAAAGTASTAAASTSADATAPTVLETVLQSVVIGTSPPRIQDAAARQAPADASGLVIVYERAARQVPCPCPRPPSAGNRRPAASVQLECKLTGVCAVERRGFLQGWLGAERSRQATIGGLGSTTEETR